MPATDLDPATTIRFVVKIDDTDLGWFNSCDGLGAQVEIHTLEEGGNNQYVHQLPTRIKYPNITLSRPLTAATAKIAAWFATMPDRVQPKTGEIVAMRGDGSVVARWSLRGVVPVSWSGPNLSPDNPKVATETIVVAHHGFSEVRSS